MTRGAAAIETRGLSKDFGSRSVLRGVSVAIAAGQCVGLLGANGSGKTTLLRCLASLVRPTAGEVLWFGESTGAPRRRGWIGMVAHESRLYPHLTLRENLMFAARMYGGAAPRLRADELLDDIGLAAHADRWPTQISRGMQQRLTLARAIVHDPAVLLLDEPFSSLDEEGCQWLTARLQALCDRGRTICFSSHDRARTQRLANVMFELRAGRLHEVARADAAAMADEPFLSRAA